MHLWFYAFLKSFTDSQKNQYPVTIWAEHKYDCDGGDHDEK